MSMTFLSPNLIVVWPVLDIYYVFIATSLDCLTSSFESVMGSSSLLLWVPFVSLVSYFTQITNIEHVWSIARANGS